MATELRGRIFTDCAHLAPGFNTRPFVLAMARAAVDVLQEHQQGIGKAKGIGERFLFRNGYAYSVLVWRELVLQIEGDLNAKGGPSL